MRHRFYLLLAAVLAGSAIAFIPSRATSEERLEPHVVAASPREAGRYIIRIGGCNDCHTAGHMQLGELVPESQWLTGVPIGWKGPWGTTYASNLRLSASQTTEDLFVQTMQKRNARPPMPWTAIHAMSDQDLRAVYQYLKSLGPKGAAMPEALPPGVEPKTPYIDAMPKNLPIPTTNK